MLVGHRRNLEYLSRVLARGVFAHAYVFHGPEAVGKRTIAFEFAKALLCPQMPQKLGGCGSCESCTTVETLSHPDLFFLAPEHLMAAEENKREVGIKNVRELRRRLAQSAWRGGSRVAIIDNAENLSREAQPALLKILEEPGAGTVFIFVTSVPAALLLTIYSRSIPVNFSLVSDDEMLALVGKIPAGRRSVLSALAGGRPGVLARLVSDPVFCAAATAENAGFEQLMTSDLPGQFEFSAKRSAEVGKLESFLLFLIQRFRRDVLLALRDYGGSEFDVKLAARIGFLNLLLSRLAWLKSAALNRRLAADGIFLELATLAPPSAEKI